MGIELLKYCILATNITVTPLDEFSAADSPEFDMAGIIFRYYPGNEHFCIALF